MFIHTSLTACIGLCKRNLLTECCRVAPLSQAFSSSITVFSSSVLLTVNSSLWLWEAPLRAWLSTDTWPLPESPTQTPEMGKKQTLKMTRWRKLGQNSWPAAQCHNILTRTFIKFAVAVGVCDTFSIQNDLLPSPPASQSFTPPLTLSHDVWGEKITIPDSSARIANRCFQSFWTKRLIGRNSGGWYEIMRSQLMASASSMTASVRSLVSSMVLIGRDLLGSTSRPTLSHDSARDRGASCSITCRTSFSSIRPEQWAERERQRVEEMWTDEWRGTEACWLVKKLRLWVGGERDGGVDETVEGELLPVQSLLKTGVKTFLHPVNIRGDLCGHKKIISLVPPY